MIDRQSQSGKVTLEDLLRLKRAERPPAEFWADFERSLHAKQLAAIVEKRPWWRQRAWLKTSRWSLPLSAAAALAVTFAAVGHPTIGKLKSTQAVTGRLASKSVLTPAPLATAASAPVSPSQVEAIVLKEAAQPVSVSPSAPEMTLASIERKAAAPILVAATTVPAVASVLRSNSSRDFNMTEQIAGLSVPADDSAGARFANVSARSSMAVPELGSFLDKSVARLDSSRAEKTRAVEPLSQLPTPKEARRARLVALLSLPGYEDASDATSTTSRSRERSLNHFNDQALYDAISRLEMKGKHSSDAAIQF